MPPDQPQAGHGDARGRVDDEQWLVAWVARAWLAWRLELLGMALVVAVATTWMLSGMGVHLGVSAAAGTAAAALLSSYMPGLRSDLPVVAATERTTPALQNALLAWRETRTTASLLVRRHLAAQARGALHGASRPHAVSTLQWLMVLALVIAAVLVHLVPRRSAAPAIAASTSAAAPTPVLPPLAWSVTVTPPAYAGRPATRLANPMQVEALAGSTIAFTFSGWRRGASVRAGTVTHAVAIDGDEARSTITATAPEVVVVEGTDGQVLASVALIVQQDAVPDVRITAPAADQRRESATGTVTIRLVARDDLGLRDLRLRFTKVSGSGESFTFEDGEWPVRVRRGSRTAWTGEYAVDLSGLSLGPGDSVVYHAVAHDGRPGPEGAAESERFLIEIVKPGAQAAGDFSLPEPEDKFALSQRMVIQLTERLLEKRPRMRAEEYREQAQALAVAQRSVRAEFVFMLGGEVEDEFEEAAHSHEVEAGRLDNRGQSDLTEAVRQMSQAETRLTAADLREALPYEYKALAALQAAFGKARYFMRTLPTPVQIDTSRRLTGEREGLISAAWQFAPLAETSRQDSLALLASLERGSGDVPAETLRRIVALDTSHGGWVAQVQQVLTREGRGGLSRLLRARLATSSPLWFPVRLARSGDEAVTAAPR